MSYSKTSYLLPRGPPQVETVEINKNPRRSASSLVLRDRIRRLFLHQDHSSSSRLESSSTRSGARFVIIASWLKVKAEVLKLLYTNMLVLFTWLLAGLVILPVIFASIRNSRGIGRARKAMFSAV
jgi:Flp pilus assembly protein TadB